MLPFLMAICSRTTKTIYLQGGSESLLFLSMVTGQSFWTNAISYSSLFSNILVLLRGFVLVNDLVAILKRF